MQQIHDSALRTIAGHPATFVVNTLKAFRANQGMLLAGAVVVVLNTLIDISYGWFDPRVRDA